MVRRFRHIDYRTGDPWVLPIWSAIHSAEKQGKIGPTSQELSDLALHISIKLDFLPRIISRINNQLTNLYREVRKRNPEKDGADGQGTFTGYVLTVNEDNKFGLLIDIDSLLFEINSCCELIQKYVGEIFRHTGNPIKDVGRYLRRILQAAGQDVSWFIEPDKTRNYFMHLGAPYFAIDLDKEPDYDLLIMKRNIQTFENEEEDYIRLSILSNIVKGFARGRAILQSHIIDHINGL